MSNKIDMTVFEELLARDTDSEMSLEDVILHLAEGDVSAFVSYNGTWDQYNKDTKAFKDETGYEHLDQDGGGEGGAEYCYGVFKLQGKIYRAEYSYYSHNGYEYDGISDTLREVKPIQKTITVYE